MKVQWIVGALAVITLCVGGLICMAFAQVIQERSEVLVETREDIATPEEVEPTSTTKPSTVPLELPTVTITSTETVAPTATSVALDIEATNIAEAMMPTATVATPTTVPPTESSTPEVKVTASAPNDIYTSGGLGMSRAQWEQGHEHTGNWLGVYEEYEGGARNSGYNIGFYGDRVARIDKSFPRPFITATEADIIGDTLIPRDAVLQEVYTPSGRPETTVRLFYSPSLASRFNADLFCDTEPGYFIVQYNNFEGEIEYVLISIGNCP
jgi:hypothetical protein